MKSNKQSPEEFAAQQLEKHQKLCQKIAPAIIQSTIGNAVIGLLERGEEISHDGLRQEFLRLRDGSDASNLMRPTYELALELLDQPSHQEN